MWSGWIGERQFWKSWNQRRGRAKQTATRGTTCALTISKRLYAHNYWANRNYLPFLSQLSPVQIHQRVPAAMSPLGTRRSCPERPSGAARRCGGPPRGEKLRQRNYPTLESLSRNGIGGRINARVLSGSEDDDLAREIEFAFGGPQARIPLRISLQHGAYSRRAHRGQRATAERAQAHHGQTRHGIYDVGDRFPAPT